MAFLLYILFFWIGTAGVAKVLYFSIQPDQWLDRLVKWQDRLNRVGTKGGVWNEIKYKALGGCEFCFAHFIALISFILFVIIIYFGIGMWGCFENVIIQWIFNIVIYLFYVWTSTTLNSIVINRL